MMADNVVKLGMQGPSIRKEPHEGCIKHLERLLQDARAGDIVGFTVTHMDPDGVAGYSIVGFVGGYNMLGAAQCVVGGLTDINRGVETSDA